MRVREWRSSCAKCKKRVQTKKKVQILMTFCARLIKAYRSGPQRDEHVFCAAQPCDVYAAFPQPAAGLEINHSTQKHPCLLLNEVFWVTAAILLTGTSRWTITILTWLQMNIKTQNSLGKLLEVCNTVCTFTADGKFLGKYPEHHVQFNEGVKIQTQVCLN